MLIVKPTRALQILRSDGPRGLFRGFGVAAVGGIPGNMAYFGGYELGKLLVPPGMGMPGDMAVGAVAQVNVCTGVGIISRQNEVGKICTVRKYLNLKQPPCS